MTDIETYYRWLDDLEKGKSYDECLGVVKELMVKDIERQIYIKALHSTLSWYFCKELFERIVSEAEGLMEDIVLEDEHQFFIDVMPEKWRDD